MILSNLTKSTVKSKRRRGRGIGSTRGGHTTGRGGKGDKIRGSTKLTFDGTKIKKSWLKRLPFLRGKSRTGIVTHKFEFSYAQLEKWFEASDTVDLKKIATKGGIPLSILSKRGVKILASAKVNKKFLFANEPALQTSQSISRRA